MTDLPPFEEAQAEAAKVSTRVFCEAAWPILEPSAPFVPGWHIDAMAEHLDAVEAGQIQNLVINVPPGHMKSILCNVMWPAKIWGRKPQTRFAFASYAASLAWRDSRKFRQVIGSPWYRRWIRGIDLEKDTEALITNTHTGFRQCMSVDGDTTGNRSDGFVIDDPLNATDSQSAAAIENCLWWWTQGMANRLNDLRHGWRVIIQQRLHEKDLTGHVLKEAGWVHLCLPSVYEPDRRCVTSIGWSDPRNTEGELLFPERFPQTVLDAEKLRLGSYGWAGQHQQLPSPSGGGLFKRVWFRYFDRDRDHYVLHAPDGDRRIWSADCMIFQTADLAMSTKESADWTVIATWAKTKQNELLLLDIERFRQEAPEVKAALKSSRQKWKPLFQGIEKAHYGVEVCQQWLREGVPLKELVADKDKLTRSVPAQLLTENGRVYFLAGAPWLTDLETELTTFPVGANDDQVDSLSYAAQIVAENEYAVPPIPSVPSQSDVNRQVVIQ